MLTVGLPSHDVAPRKPACGSSCTITTETSNLQKIVSGGLLEEDLQFLAMAIVLWHPRHTFDKKSRHQLLDWMAAVMEAFVWEPELRVKGNNSSLANVSRWVACSSLAEIEQ